jgi:hypothetical protein
MALNDIEDLFIFFFVWVLSFVVLGAFVIAIPWAVTDELVWVELYPNANDLTKTEIMKYNVWLGVIPHLIAPFIITLVVSFIITLAVASNW